MAAMLKQREKDIEYRQQFDSKMIRMQQDKEVYEEKFKKAVKQSQEFEKEKYALQVQIKEKANEVKNTLEKQKNIYKEQSGTSSKLEQKISSLQIELKKMESSNVKLQDQIKRLMGMDKLYYQNSIDMVSKAHEGQAIQKCIPEAEFVDLVKNG